MKIFISFVLLLLLTATSSGKDTEPSCGIKVVFAVAGRLRPQAPDWIYEKYDLQKERLSLADIITTLKKLHIESESFKIENKEDLINQPGIYIVHKNELGGHFVAIDNTQNSEKPRLFDERSNMYWSPANYEKVLENGSGYVVFINPKQPSINMGMWNSFPEVSITPKYFRFENPIQQGERIQTEITVQNHTMEGLWIEKTETSSGCTSTTLKRPVSIPRGHDKKISVFIDTSEKEGWFTEEVCLHLYRVKNGEYSNYESYHYVHGYIKGKYPCRFIPAPLILQGKKQYAYISNLPKPLQPVDIFLNSPNKEIPSEELMRLLNIKIMDDDYVKKIIFPVSTIPSVDSEKPNETNIGALQIIPAKELYKKRIKKIFLQIRSDNGERILGELLIIP